MELAVEVWDAEAEAEWLEDGLPVELDAAEPEDDSEADGEVEALCDVVQEGVGDIVALGVAVAVPEGDPAPDAVGD